MAMLVKKIKKNKIDGFIDVGPKSYQSKASGFNKRVANEI